MSVQRFLTPVLLVSLAIASGPSTVHTRAAPPPAAAQSETSGSWRSGGPYGGHADALALSPAYLGDPTLFAGTNDGLYRSTDGTGQWRL